MRIHGCIIDCIRTPPTHSWNNIFTIIPFKNNASLHLYENYVKKYTWSELWINVIIALSMLLKCYWKRDRCLIYVNKWIQINDGLGIFLYLICKQCDKALTGQNALFLFWNEKSKFVMLAMFEIFEHYFNTWNASRIIYNFYLITVQDIMLAYFICNYFYKLNLIRLLKIRNNEYGALILFHIHSN